MRAFPALLVCLVGLPQLSAAQAVSDCDQLARADAIMEPWEENTRTFLGGKVRLAAIDTIEPAAAAFHLLVISPPFDEVGGRQCKLVSAGNGSGFGGLSFPDLTAAYNPAHGFDFAVPVQVYAQADGDFVTRMLQVRLNPTTGAIVASLDQP